MKPIFVALAGLALAGCASAPSPLSVEMADVIYLNGDVWTGVDGAARQSAVAIKGDKILYVGDRPGAHRHHGEATEIVDLAGAFVAPGFIDGHTHFIGGGFSLASIQLNGAKSREEFIRRIADYAAGRPKGEWILNGNWDEEGWGGQMPTRDWIDKATPDNPVMVVRYDGHAVLANSMALKLAGVDAATPTPPGGEIMRDAAGAPTGVIKDAAISLIEKVIPPASDAQIEEAFLRAQAYAFENGVTEINDMAMPTGGMENLETLWRLHEAGAMTIRVNTFAPIAQWSALKDFIAENGRGDDQFRWDGVKGFVDGSLGSRTAWFYESYDDADTTGLTLAEPATIAEQIRAADAAGLRIAVHAIGDHANDFLLDAFADIGGAAVKEKRFRVEHAQHLTPGEIEKFAARGIVASMQPYHAIDDGRWAIKRIGAERLKATYAFRSLIDAGAIVAFGSDWPVAPMTVIKGIDAAVLRQTLDGANPDGWVPAQMITGEEALRAYTRANAYAGFEEDRFGTVEAGKFADLVVLSGDPTKAADAEAFAAIKVLRTILGGDTVYVASQ